MPADRTKNGDGLECYVQAQQQKSRRESLRSHHDNPNLDQGFTFIDLTGDSDEESVKPIKRHASDAALSRSTRRVSKGASPPCNNASFTTAPKEIKIRNQKLRPTVVFDTLWRWAYERKVVDDRRRAGMPRPWTNDRHLREHFFCNTFRVLDKVTQYIISEVIEKGNQSPQEVVFRVVLFNTFTKIATWELLQARIGKLTWASYKREAYADVLLDAKNSGQTLYTCAFQKPAPKFGHDDLFMNHLELLEMLMNSDLAGYIASAQYIVEIYEFIISFPGMGPFNSYQLLLNLSYTSVAHFHSNDFVVPGIGAISGLTKLFGKSFTIAYKDDPEIAPAIIRYLVRTQNSHFERLGLKFPGLGPKNLPMDVADMEHAVCEVDKYARLAHPSIKGTTNRTRMKRSGFTPASDLPKVPHTPKAWSHPKRAVERVRAEPAEINLRYVIQAIDDHRETEHGDVEYHVKWWGYGPEDSTWQAEWALLEDAPDAVAEYRRNLGLSQTRTSFI
ncbi:hypothetical protein HGRIS_006962 [Hohenbuehelia grisea]|uniref:Chromo domain-containing protein n=1 Tax=Hohenbuehelia grisea TaxID=104357 RepID=A0ABR3JB15_9AGAR